MEKSKLISLKHLRVLEISGKGAFDLLQGQITCDIEKIKSERSALGALCNAKGRVVSSFIVYLIKKDTYPKYIFLQIFGIHLLLMQFLLSHFQL